MRSKVTAEPPGVALWWMTIHCQSVRWPVGSQESGTSETRGVGRLTIGAWAMGAGGVIAFGGGVSTVGRSKLGGGSWASLDLFWQPADNTPKANTITEGTTLAIHGSL